MGVYKMTNTCTRCGSERILAKTWEEVIEGYSNNNSKLICSQLVCPDPKCQKLVEDQWAQQKAKREYAEQQKEIAKAEKIKENARLAARHI